MQDIDLLIVPRWIIPVAPSGQVLERYAVAVDRGRILALLPEGAAAESFRPRQRCDLPAHALIPGLVNLHTHAAMTLLRGLADDRPLMTWLQEHIWPAEGRHVSSSFVRDGTLLACAEMLRSGTTCFNDMYFFPQAAAGAAVRAGMRAMIGMAVLEFPTAYASDADDYIAKGLAARDALRESPGITTCLAPHAPYTVSDRSFTHLLTLAEQLDLRIHLHLHETHDEITQSLASHGCRPLERLRRLGLLGPGLIAVHAVHLEEHEIDLLAVHGASIAHCPTSNLKLASGIAPIARALARGVNVGIGTDGAASNNRLDLLRETSLAALLAKGSSGDAAALPAHRAIELATLGGARALGLEHEIGSIEPGKAADLCAIRFDALELAPCYDPASHLAYAAGREHVTHVWVNGSLRLDNGRHTWIDEEELKNTASLWQTKISPRNPM